MCGCIKISEVSIISYVCIRKSYICVYILHIYTYYTVYILNHVYIYICLKPLIGFLFNCAKRTFDTSFKRSESHEHRTHVELKGLKCKEGQSTAVSFRSSRSQKGKGGMNRSFSSSGGRTGWAKKLQGHSRLRHWNMSEPLIGFLFNCANALLTPASKGLRVMHTVPTSSWKGWNAKKAKAQQSAFVPVDLKRVKVEWTGASPLPTIKLARS